MISTEREMQMGNLDKRFMERFRELEQGHIERRTKLNGLRIRGDDLEDLLREEIELFEPWRFELMDELGRITEEFSDEQSSAHLAFIKKSKYYKIVQEAPFYWQIMNKPNGYAGDAQMMSFIYRNQFEGQTPFGMFLHKHAVSTKACQAVRNRKLYLRQQLVDLREGCVLSLAAGPAQEIREILDIYPDNHYQFLALDHDMETLQKYDASNHEHRFKYALANAFQIIAGNYMVARPRRAFVKFCVPRRDFTGFRRVLAPVKYEMNQLKKESYDLIYSSGLYDYIKTFSLDDSKGTVALTKNLFELLKPGGTLLVGNFSPNNPRDLRFPMDYIYEWHLIYRTKEELLDFARAIPDRAIDEIDVVEEPLGISYFLRIKKKAWEASLPLPKQAFANFLM